MFPRVSVVVPNHNGAATIGRCLEAAFRSQYEDFEVIVVDDCSDDSSLDVIARFPCELVRLEKRSGASRARNAGAARSHGELLFFTDADCLLEAGTLAAAVAAITAAGPDAVLGGTYTARPVDDSFYSRFQSVFISYSETASDRDPDYIATHAMMIAKRDFENSGGFAEDYLPILEDVEFSHRLRRRGYRLLMDRAVVVRHVFGYSLAGSMRNAFRKSMYWTAYSIDRRDLLADSGTASTGLKLNAAAWMVNALILLLYAVTGSSQLLTAILPVAGLNGLWNAGLLRAFHAAGGKGFAVTATAYYMLVYPAALWTGFVSGMLCYPRLRSIMRGAH